MPESGKGLNSPPKRIRPAVAVIPILFLIAALFVTIVVLKQDPHIPLLLAGAVAAAVGVLHGHRWPDIQKGIIHGISLAMGAILILMVVGTMIGTWISGGIVPAMMFYGLKILSPGIFLAATLVICSIVSIGTGSSWSTAGTVGVALIGIGQGLGIPTAMVAGAIVSGAYFGDKISPLSDTTNLAPAVSGTDLFTHVRHMMYTAVPGYLAALVLFGILGMRFAGGRIESDKIEAFFSTIQGNFQIHPVLLLPPVLVIVMVVLRVPPLPALLGGMLLGAGFGMAMQGRTLAEVVLAAKAGFVSTTGVPMVDDLLTRGGLDSMMNTVALILCALAFGGIMERTGTLQVLAEALLRKVRRTGPLVATTVLSCIGMNVIASDQYMAIVIPGRMYRSAYIKLRLHPKNLSRALEASGTLTSPLIPWNSCGAFMGATLGISPLLYLPYAFLNLFIPLITVLYGYTGITMHKMTPDEVKALEEDPERTI